MDEKHVGSKEALELLKSLDIPLDSPWKYDPYLLIGTKKRLKVPDPQDHETRLGEEKLASKESYEEVDAILKRKGGSSRIEEKLVKVSPNISYIVLSFPMKIYQS